MTFEKWGYAEGGKSQIFTVSLAEPKLPQGWYESPADIPEKKEEKKETKPRRTAKKAK